ncbi:MAG: hypothetical protein IMHGJWDQ_001794 [Candidatus Fervidibacter sp.]
MVIGDRDERQQLRVNEQIRVPKVLVIDENGQKLGVMETRDALRLARSKGLDLIEVAPHARPPVCRIMDYGKFKYQQQKREREARKHHKEMKEIRLSPQMSEHDLRYRIKNAEEFLMEGHRVRIFMQPRGRWVAHLDLGEAKLQEFVNHLSHVAVVEMPITHQGNMLVVVLAPRKDAKAKPTPVTAKPVTPPIQPTPPSPLPTSLSQESTEAIPSELQQPEKEPPKVIEVASDGQ